MANQRSTIVQAPDSIRLAPEEKRVLQRLFAGYSRVALEREFGMGLSGCRVFRVRPVEAGGKAHTPALVKIGPIDIIEKEWQAYESWVRDRLPGVALVTSQPIIPRGSSWGALRYQLVGGGIFEVQSLSQFYRQASVEDVLWVLQRRLFPVMGRSWWLVHRVEPTFQLQSDYDRLLPVNLMVTAMEPTPPGKTTIITPEQHSVFDTGIGDLVRVRDFLITEVDIARRMVTLNLPRSAGERRIDSLRLRVQGVSGVEQMQVGDKVDAIEGRVTDTRHTLLEAEARKAMGESVDLGAELITLPGGSCLPNPLLHYRKILHDSFLDVKLSTIHGDFNLENILVDPDTRDVRVIDFATVHQGHALHDLLRMETEIITKLISETLAEVGLPPETMLPFYQQLHNGSFGELVGAKPQVPDPCLEKPFKTLVAIRQEARKCFFNPEDHTEYYYGLILYLLGALKFKNLDTVPCAKEVAFFGAATALQLLQPSADTEVNQVHPTVDSLESETLSEAGGAVYRVPWIKIAVVIALVLLVAGITYARAQLVDADHLNALDDNLTVELVEGHGAHDAILDYFAAANTALFEHLANTEQAYLQGQAHKGITYVWGAPGVGKSFVSRNRLYDEFPGDSCLIKLGDLFRDDAAQLGFEVVRRPDLATIDWQIAFDNLPTVAQTRDYDLDSLFLAGGCKQEHGLVPLIIVDDIDEIHSQTSNIILRSLDRFIIDLDLNQQEFTHVVVFGRTEGFASWYQDPRRNDEIAKYLHTFWLRGPEYETTGDVAVLADSQGAYVLGETWEEMKADDRATEFIDGYVRYVRRHPILTYSLRRLAVATMIVDRPITNPNDTETELKDFLFEELLRRAAHTHGRPLTNDGRYVCLLEEIAVGYAQPPDKVDEEGFFNVSVSDTVPVIEDGGRVGEVFVRDVLDHSGIAVLEPASYATARYRFDPVWVHAYLVESRNQRRIPFLQERVCDK